jgi:diguanylate cyclase (GGDEF)-like protein
MWAKVKQFFSMDAFKDDEDRQAAQTLLVIITGALVACLATVIGGLYWKAWSVFLIGLGGILLHLVPFGLLRRGNLRLSSVITGIFALVIVTIAATLGQGIHDISIMAYPVIIIIGSLIMQRHGFILLSALTVISIGWLIYGEASSLFVTRPIRTPSWADFLIMLAFLLVAVAVVYLQAKNMRENLGRAREEIAHRKDIEEQLRHLGTHDILTGIYNRVFFEQELARLEISREFPVSVIIADLDDMKKTNDTLGHNAGDELLKRAAAALRSTFREGDVLARIGGDEYSVLLPKTDAATAEQMLARVRVKLVEHNVMYPDLPIALSLGTATARKGELTQAFKLADQRMYVDKFAHKSGGNKPQIP